MSKKSALRLEIYSKNIRQAKIFYGPAFYIKRDEVKALHMGLHSMN